MNKFVKSIVCAVACAFAAFSATVFSACFQGPAGPAGPMGQDLDFYDVYNAVNAERAENGEQPLTVSEFVKEYFGYISSEAEEAQKKQAVMNYSLLSSVAILSDYTTGSSILGSNHETYAGSGVIVDIDKDKGDAYIVTNAHVVYEPTSKEKYCNSVYVYLYGNDEAYEDYNLTSGGVLNYNGIDASDVKIIGVSITYDLAVLKVSGSDVIKNSRAVAATFCQEDEYFAGETVYAVGNPEGAGLTVTEGIISRESEIISLEIDKAREYRVMRTDAAVNGGNSGGGLFNADGEMVGIINSKNEEEGIDNIAFALPSSYARRIVQSMIDSYEKSGQLARSVSKALIGITSQVSNTYAYYDGELGVTRISEVVTVADAQYGGAASDVLREGDVIKKFSIGKCSSLRSNTLQSSPAADFTVPEGDPQSIDGRYCSFDVTRQYMITDAMFSVRTGDVVELVIERGSTTMYAYFVYSSSAFFTSYN